MDFSGLYKHPVNPFGTSVCNYLKGRQNADFTRDRLWHFCETIVRARTEQECDQSIPVENLRLLMKISIHGRRHEPFPEGVKRGTKTHTVRHLW